MLHARRARQVYLCHSLTAWTLPRSSNTGDVWAHKAAALQSAAADIWSRLDSPLWHDGLRFVPSVEYWDVIAQPQRQCIGKVRGDSVHNTARPEPDLDAALLWPLPPNRSSCRYRRFERNCRLPDLYLERCRRNVGLVDGTISWLASVCNLSLRWNRLSQWMGHKTQGRVEDQVEVTALQLSMSHGFGTSECWYRRTYPSVLTVSYDRIWAARCRCSFPPCVQPKTACSLHRALLCHSSLQCFPS